MAPRLVLLALLGLALTVAAQNVCNAVHANTTFSGPDLATTTPESAGACCDDCQVTVGCRFYVYVDGVCHLKHDRGLVEQLVGATAGGTSPPLCTVFEPNTDYIGYDLGNTSRATADSCCSDCEATPGCRVFVYRNSMCLLKSDRGRRQTTIGAQASRLLDSPTSALCPIVYDNSNTLGTAVGESKRESAAECCADCAALPSCTHWVWTVRDNGTCIFKSGTGQRVYFLGAIAGTLANSSIVVETRSTNDTSTNTDNSTTPGTIVNAGDTPIPTFPTFPPRTKTPIPTFPTLPPRPSTPPPTTAAAAIASPTPVPPPTTAPTSTPSPTAAPIPPTSTSPTTTTPSPSPSATSAPSSDPATSQVPSTAVPPTVPPTPTNSTAAPPSVIPTPSTNASTPVPTPTTPAPSRECADNRVRQSWAAMTSDAQLLYVNAVATAMETGAYSAFVRVFSAAPGAMGTATSFLWRRRFLAAFENLLRSLKPIYACVTVPYWDYTSEFNAWVTAQCKGVADCAPITRGLGGVYDGTTGNTVSVFGYTRPDLRCVSGFPLSKFCAATGACAHCLPRDDWRTTKYMPDIALPLLKMDLFGAGDAQGASVALETRLLPIVHQWLGGMVANPHVAVADPVVFSLFATFDLLQSVYYKCSIAPLGSKRAEAVAFLAGGVATVVGGYNDTALATPWFTSVPSAYTALLDTMDMGGASYSYDVVGPIASMRNQCEKVGIPSKANRDAVAAASNGTAPFATLNSANTLMTDWHEQMYALGQQQGLPNDAIDTEIAKILVVTTATCRNVTIAGYAPEFASDWKLTAPAYAKSLHDDVQSGASPIRIQNHAALTARLLSCK
ncbi:hypothetical protein ACHHYP_09737 [Achlya hypogyna]|uniref:Secreted protein n=1 Tax=Achlya hypogyna TaxID=1202772 RepID=A0A0A7CP65_ACHHY|nr:secreted protein [Achlya hypogyna]OQR86922.1 hypothetical protein ACHHYP_09737 [Achlya hypogyna]